MLNISVGSRLWKLRRNLREEYQKYDLWPDNNEEVRFRSILESLNFQPFAAWVGLILDLLIVFVFSTASWWKQPVTPTKFFAAYAGVSWLHGQMRSNFESVADICCSP